MKDHEDFLGINLQAWIIVFIVTFLAFWYFLTPAYGQDVYIEKTIPTEAAVTVVLVAQCGNAIGLYATMPDGRLLAFDMRSSVPFKETIQWAQRAKRAITVEAQCRLAPGGIST